MIAALVLAAAVAIPPRPSEYVTDTASVLSSSTKQQVGDELRAYEQTTKHHVIVWIGQTTGDDALEDWTIHAAEQWKVGRKGVDDGAILFMFMQDRKIRIEVGYGLESALTDASAGEIIRNTIAPKMRAGDVDGAVQSGVDRMLLTITPSFASQIHHQVADTSDDQSGSDSVSSAALVFIAVIFLIVLISIFASRRGRGGIWYWGGYSGGGWGGGGGGGGFSGSFGGGFGGGGASGGW